MYSRFFFKLFFTRRASARRYRPRFALHTRTGSLGLGDEQAAGALLYVHPDGYIDEFSAPCSSDTFVTDFTDGYVDGHVDGNLFLRHKDYTEFPAEYRWGYSVGYRDGYQAGYRIHKPHYLD